MPTNFRECNKLLNLARSLIYLKLGVPFPFSVVFWITEKCNARCKMCNVWQLKDTKEMDIETFRKVFETSKILRRVSLFTFTGGEPFLKEDLPEFVRIVNKNANPLEIRFTTNGFATQVIKSSLKEILQHNKKTKYTIKISIDGFGKTHDEMRGVKNGFERVMSTLDELILIKEEYPNLSLIIGFTANSINYKEIDKVYELTKEKNIGFFYKPIIRGELISDDADALFLTEKQKQYLTNFQNTMIKELRNRPFRERKIYTSYYQLINRYFEMSSRLVTCHACSASCHIAPNWDVFCCYALMNSVVGNLKTNSFDEIWNNKKIREFREMAKKCDPFKYPCLCTGDMIPSIIVNKFPFF